MYVLNVDLWSDNGGGEVNLVRHSANAPAVSGTIPVSFGQMPPAPHQFIGGSSGPSSSPSSSSPYNPYPGPPNVNPYAQPDNSTYMPGHYPPPPQVSLRPVDCDVMTNYMSAPGLHISY